MVRITRIYTRSGDDGSTGLADGTRIRKDGLRIEAYGTVDELNAIVGLCVRAAATEGLTDIESLLRGSQHDLFDLGADLATPGQGAGLRILKARVDALESAIDEHNADLPPLESFVLPGGSELSSWLHVARTVCRRAERLSVSLAETEELGDVVVPYLNRLSDLFFVLGRVANDSGRTDIEWIPGKNRDA